MIFRKLALDLLSSIIVTFLCTGILSQISTNNWRSFFLKWPMSNYLAIAILVLLLILLSRKIIYSLMPGSVEICKNGRSFVENGDEDMAEGQCNAITLKFDFSPRNDFPPKWIGYAIFINKALKRYLTNSYYFSFDIKSNGNPSSCDIEFKKQPDNVVVKTESIKFNSDSWTKQSIKLPDPKGFKDLKEIVFLVKPHDLISYEGNKIEAGQISINNLRLTKTMEAN